MVSMIEPTKRPALLSNLSALQIYSATDICETEDRLVTIIAPIAIILS